MALTVTTRSISQSSAALNLVQINPSSNFTANTFGVLAIAYDNAGTQGADPYTSITDNAGNTWTSRFNGLNDPGAASAGATLRIFSANIASLTTVQQITINFSATVTAKAWILYEFSSNTSGFTAGFLSANTPTTGSATAVATSSVTVNNGDAILGAVAYEDSGAYTGDSDTINGTWSLPNNPSIGTGTSAMSLAGQYKVVNATGTQTYNITLPTAADWVAGSIIVTEVSSVVADIFDPFGRSGFFGI